MQEDANGKPVRIRTERFLLDHSRSIKMWDRMVMGVENPIICRASSRFTGRLRAAWCYARKGCTSWRGRASPELRWRKPFQRKFLPTWDRHTTLPYWGVMRPFQAEVGTKSTSAAMVMHRERRDAIVSSQTSVQESGGGGLNIRWPVLPVKLNLKLETRGSKLCEGSLVEKCYWLYTQNTVYEQGPKLVEMIVYYMSQII